MQQLEIGFDETNDKLTKATESLEEADKQFKEVESDVSALTRRIMLMEEEDKKAISILFSFNFSISILFSFNFSIFNLQFSRRPTSSAPRSPSSPSCPSLRTM